MTNKTPHPYVPSPGPLVQTITQFRKAIPARIDASTLKRLSLAPNNESTVLSTFRFLGLIDSEGQTTPEAKKIFNAHSDDDFASCLEAEVQKAYSELFGLRGEDAWDAERDTLIAFFRATDETSAITGKRQAVAFETLAALSGHGEVAAPRVYSKSPNNEGPASKKSSKKERRIREKSQQTPNPMTFSASGPEGVGLTVRIEINLPAQGEQETYDRIFQSIRKNLLNGQ